MTSLTGTRDGISPLGDLREQKPRLYDALRAKIVKVALDDRLTDRLTAITISHENGQRLDAIAGRLRTLAEWCDEAHAVTQRMAGDAHLGDDQGVAA